MKKSLIILPMGLPKDWPADYELQTGRALAKNHVVILFTISEGKSLRSLLLNPEPLFLRYSRDLFLFRPLYVIPFQRFNVIRAANTWLAVWQLALIIFLHKAWRSLPKIFWAFSLQYAVFPHHFGRAYLAVYDYVDAFTSTRPQRKALWHKYEQTMLRESDIVFTNQRVLYRRMHQKHPKVIEAPIGFNSNLFSTSSGNEPRDMAPIARPRIGLVGVINNRLDFDLIGNVARGLPRVSFVFIGAVDTYFDGRHGVSVEEEIKKLTHLDNVFFLGPKEKKRLADYYTFLDLGFIPYDTSLEFNRSSLPMKTLEYFWAGLPVVATPIPSLVPLAPLVTIVHTPKDAIAAIKTLTSAPWSRDMRQKQRAFARANTWERKVAAMMRILHKEFPQYFS